MKNSDILLLENIIKQFLFEQTRPTGFDNMPAELQTDFKNWRSTQPGYGPNGKGWLNSGRLSASVYDANEGNAATTWWNQLDDELKKSVAGEPKTAEEKEQRKKDLEAEGMTEAEITETEEFKNFKAGTLVITGKNKGYGECCCDYVKETDAIDSPCVDWWAKQLTSKKILAYIGYGVLAFIVLSGFAISKKGIQGMKYVLGGLMKYTTRFIMYIIGKRTSNKVMGAESAMSRIFSELDDIFAALEKDMITRFGPDSPKVYASKNQIKTLIAEAKALLKTPAVKLKLEKDFRRYMKDLVLEGKITKQLYIAKMGKRYTKSDDMYVILKILRKKKAADSNFAKNALSELPIEPGPKTVEAIENMMIRK